MKKLHYYFLIINYFKQGVRPTRDELINYLKNHNLDISERTLYRALNDLLFDYGIEILLDYSSKTYYIAEESLSKAEIIINVLKNLVPLDSMMNDLRHKSFFDNIIEIDDSDKLAVPIDALRVLTKAINTKRQVQFDWQPVNGLKQKSLYFSPMFFRYYKNRWCVIGYNDSKLMSIEVDFISNLKLTEYIAYSEVYDHARKIFKDIVGLNYTRNECQKVKLSFNRSQWHYLKRFPIHNSQKLEQTPNGKIIATFKIKPNIDFKEQLLNFGSNVQVIEPKWLRDEVVHEIKKMLAYYE